VAFQIRCADVKNHWEERMNRTLVTTVSIAVLAWAGAANAASPQLKGQYAFTGTAACLVSTQQFNPNLTPSPGSLTVSNSFSVTGVRTFNGDGTGTIKGRSVDINPPPRGNVAPAPCTPATCPLGGISAGSSDFTAKFTYVVDGDGGFTTQLVPNTFQGTVLTGPGAGSTYTIDQFSLAGLMSINHETLTIATDVPAQETQTITPPSDPPFSRYRICHRARALTRMDN
jgi:hypothetical protein